MSSQFTQRRESRAAAFQYLYAWSVNQPANVVASEMLRLNTAIAPVPFAQQNRLGIVGNIRRENKALIAALEAQRRG